jgi:plastocyanin
MATHVLQARMAALSLVALVAAGCGPESTPLTDTLESPGISAAKGGVAGAPTTAVMRFGNNDAGTSAFGPEHPSSHARDNMIPTTVVIQAGGTVTFQVQAPHRVAIYDSGTQPEDIRLIPGVTLFDHVGPGGPPFIPNFYIDEPNGRLYIEATPAFSAPHDVSYTFAQPGKYLVICAITPHFASYKMYGWVEVR